ncbi:MAG TPA: cupin domain-containing protein [Bryobacteraceae bacterium]|nr:cupin domain-containing protein [Bryobacteraceae bacterium]
MKTALAALLLVTFAALLPAQQPAAADLKTFASSADVQALIAKAKSDHKDGQAIVLEKILIFAPYSANLEYRPTGGNAAVHDKDAEMMYVIEGSGTILTGGKMNGTKIEGGESRNVAKGDFLVVPQGTPHQFTATDGNLVLMTVKMPR